MSSVNLTEQQWGQLMNILADAPWKIANPLLMAIGEQLRLQHQPQHQAPMPSDMRVDGNSQESRHG